MLGHNINVFNHELHAMASKWHDKLQASGRKDVAVQMHDFQVGIGPQVTLDFFDALECFHPSALGHSLLNTGLWNSMLCTDDRAGRCGQEFSMHMVATCPTAESVFYVGPDVIPDIERDILEKSFNAQYDKLEFL